MNLTTELINFLQGIDPKQYARRLAANPDLQQQIVAATAEYSPKNISERVYILTVQPPVKKPCGRYPAFNSFNLGYREFCGTKTVCECARQHQSQAMTQQHLNETPQQRQQRIDRQINTNIQRYGVKNPAMAADIQQKIKDTNLKKYGAETPLQSPVVLDKIKKTNQLRRGVDYPLQSADIRLRTLTTAEARYGAGMPLARQGLWEKYPNNPFSDPAVKEKIQKTLRAKYHRGSVQHLHLSEQQLNILLNPDNFKSFVESKSLKQAAYDLGVYDTTIARYCDYYQCRELLVQHSRSINEHKIKTLLEGLAVPFLQNTRSVIAPLELDFYLPDHRVAIEVGSVFYHSEINSRGTRGKEYHWQKWQRCHQQGIALFQWFDDEIQQHWPVIVSKIKYLTHSINNKIGARKITLAPVSVTDERDFLNRCHIQGFTSDRNSELVIGGYYENKLVAVMSFKDREPYVELKRFATELDHTFPGLFSKMLKHIRPRLPKKPLISFSANCHSNGAVYAASKFKIHHMVGPTYSYTRDYHSRLNRQAFMKHKILQQHPELDPEKTEWQLMTELGYDRIWDAGKIAWVLSE